MNGCWVEVDNATLVLLVQAGIYVLCDKGKGKVRYVGQSGCLMARLSDHGASNFDVYVLPTGPREMWGVHANTEAYLRLEARRELESKLIKQLKPTDNIRK